MTGERPLYLHVGLPKTASTFLQERVFPGLDHLNVRAMPRTRRFATAGDAAAGFRAFACALRRAAGVWQAEGEALVDEILGPDDGRRGVLVSDEAIGRGASRPEGLAAHLAAFARVAAGRRLGRPRIVAFLRRQDHWLASHYAQMSDRRPGAGQAGFEALADRVLDPACERFGFGMLLDYGALHAALAEVAGPGGVLLLPHEALETEPQATLGRLLDWLGTPQDRARAVVAETADRRANVRAETREGAPSWRLRPPSLGLERFGRGRRLALPGRLWPTRRIMLGPALSARILAGYAESNRRASEAAGLDLARWGYLPAD